MPHIHRVDGRWKQQLNSFSSSWSYIDVDSRDRIAKLRRRRSSSAVCQVTQVQVEMGHHSSRLTLSYSFTRHILSSYCIILLLFDGLQV